MGVPTANLSIEAPCLGWLAFDAKIADLERLASVIRQDITPSSELLQGGASSNTYRVHGADSLSIGPVTRWILGKWAFQESRDVVVSIFRSECERNEASSFVELEDLTGRLLANSSAQATLGDAESRSAAQAAKHTIEPTPMNAIREALAAEDYYGARALAERAHREHPEDAELAAAARVLAPPRVLRADLPPDPSIRVNMDWMEHEAANYSGQWVAVKEGKVVGVAPTARELKEQVPNLKGLFVVKVA